MPVSDGDGIGANAQPAHPDGAACGSHGRREAHGVIGVCDPRDGALVRVLRAGERTLELGRQPWLMGIVNASPDSFSDDGSTRTLDRQAGLARELVDSGADILDVGGESARTDVPPVPAQEEIELVVPLIERVVATLETIVSLDTYKPEVAAAAIAAGATIVNDVSGLRDPGLARVCAETGAALVLMHTRAAPKQRMQDPECYGEDVTGEVLEFLRTRIELATAAGVAHEQLIIDPGPDFAKTPAQTIALLAESERLHELERPLLMAVSRKDFIGALTSRPPRERLAGTLAALAHGVDKGAHIFRLHDIVAARDYLTVRAALAGASTPRRDLALAEELRHEP
jgi:dihydropteroate synthase